MRVRPVEAGNHRLCARFGRKRLAVVGHGEQNCLFAGPDADQLHGGIERKPAKARRHTDQKLPAVPDGRELRRGGAQLAKRKIARVEVGIDEIVDRGRPEQLCALVVGP